MRVHLNASDLSGNTAPVLQLNFRTPTDPFAKAEGHRSGPVPQPMSCACRVTPAVSCAGSRGTARSRPRRRCAAPSRSPAWTRATAPIGTLSTSGCTRPPRGSARRRRARPMTRYGDSVGHCRPLHQRERRLRRDHLRRRSGPDARRRDTQRDGHRPERAEDPGYQRRAQCHRTVHSTGLSTRAAGRAGQRRRCSTCDSCRTSYPASSPRRPGRCGWDPTHPRTHSNGSAPPDCRSSTCTPNSTDRRARPGRDPRWPCCCCSSAPSPVPCSRSGHRDLDQREQPPPLVRMAALHAIGSSRSITVAGRRVIEQLLLLGSAVLLGLPTGLLAARLAHAGDPGVLRHDTDRCCGTHRMPADACVRRRRSCVLLAVTAVVGGLRPVARRRARADCGRRSDERSELVTPRRRRRALCRRRTRLSRRRCRTSSR